MARGADAEITRRLCEIAPCTRRLDTVSDGTAVSRPLPALCGQFLGRTFWWRRKLTLNGLSCGHVRSFARRSDSLPVSYNSRANWAREKVRERFIRNSRTGPCYDQVPHKLFAPTGRR